MTLTRHQRRRLRKDAARTARVIAATTMHRTVDGRLDVLRDPVALGALERGFRALLKNNCRPVVQELTPDEGERLRNPGYVPSPPLPGVRHWLACGLDVETRGTFTTCWTCMAGMTEAERIALEDLAAACNVAGVPMEGAQ